MGHAEKNTRGLVSLLALALSLAGLPAAAADASAPKPNVVIMLADDLGYADVGFNGCKDVATPNIDMLAASGVRFSQAYVTAPICSPSRAGLLTGRHPQRWGHDDNGTEELPLAEATLAERLKAMGYVTGMVGKWHLGGSRELLPTMRGFDEVFHPDGNARYANAPVLDSRISRTEFQPANDTHAYTTELNSARAVEFIRRHKAAPFFLYVAYHNVHMPLEAPRKYLDRVPAPLADPERRIMAAMVLALDDAVGEVTRALRENDLEENTLVIFLNDNGGVCQLAGKRPGVSYNTPFSGGKYTLKEGGVRVPFVLQWKARFPQPRVFEAPVSALDILPTVVSACGGTIRQEWRLDGVNLLAFLDGRAAGEPHPELYWRVKGRIAIRKGDWKLQRADERAALELYNLREDPGESRNLARAHPEKVSELETAWKQWNGQLPPPREAAKPGTKTLNPKENDQE